MVEMVVVLPAPLPPSSAVQDPGVRANEMPSTARVAYKSGARIFHQKFGYGTVLAADGDKLDIEFDKAGGKKVLASFVLPADQAR